MKKVLASLLLASFILSACGPQAPSTGSFQQDAANKITEVQLTQDDLAKDFAGYTIKEEENDSRYGLGGREVYLMQDEKEVFRMRYMSFASEEALETNLAEIGAGDDMEKAGFGEEAYKSEDRKKITFRQDDIKMDVTVLAEASDGHEMDEVEDLADLMLDKF
ncbi:MAG: hypothetical protein PHU71_01335 [Candidatus Gracilibacteria bacterium]|nr:hypothetical protein [Candidatus Gracilibacteria bacterium]